MTTPFQDRIKTTEVAPLCSYGNTPLVMSGFLKQFYTQIFADTEHVYDPHLRQIMERDGVWLASAKEQAGIYIDVISNWEPALTESRFALVIKENDWNYVRLGRGDKNGTDYRSGRETYTAMWKGSHTIFALAKRGAQAQMLAVEAMRNLTYFGSLISNELRLHKFIPLQVGALRTIKEATETYAAPISVAYVREESWYVQPDAPRLKKIHFDPDKPL